MSDKINYFNQSMNEIVFDERNKDYGAFLLRKNYSKRLIKALTLTITVFILCISAPTIIKYLGFFKEPDEEVFDMTIFVLHPPPSINPLEPPKPPPPAIEEVKRPTEKFMEIEAVEEKKVVEPPPPTVEDLAKKELNNKIIDAPKSNDPPLVPADLLGGANGDGKIWNKVEQPPEFIGGEDAYFQFMGSHLIYPDEEKGEGIEGVARLYFVVTQEGLIENIKIIKSSGNSHLDEEAIRLIKIQPKYNPGKQNGKAVKVACITEIEFKLN